MNCTTSSFSTTGFIILLAAGLVATAPQITAFGESPTTPLSVALAGDSGSLQSLEALQRSLQLKEAEAAMLQEEMAAATHELMRDELRQRLQEVRAAIEEQRQQFDGFALNVDLSPFSPQRDSKFDWQEQVGKLLEPILAEFESATAESRVIGQLRGQLEDVRKRRDIASQAVANLEALLVQPASEELRRRLETRLQAWRRTFDQVENEYSALDLQLQSRLAARESVLDSATTYARNFFKTRGLNLLLGVLSFLVVFFGFRLGEYLIRRLRRKGARKNFSTRLTSLLFHIFSVLGGLVAMMLAFNIAGDWFLLGIVIIFLFGVGWASINTLPQQIETIKLMLNIGAVREGEWLRYDGTPYRVESLGFSARLRNPRLEGGQRQLPVKYLVGMTSRPVGEHENWFPSETGDWVVLSDGQVGQVHSQTPCAVELIAPGGDHRVYPTPDYLELHPRNLSERFRITTTFGIDYRHQAAATREIPATMLAALQSELPAVIGADNLLDVQVLFSSAGSSSLDYTIRLDVLGSAAPLYSVLPGTIQRILVDACTANQWNIPFPQLTLHQA